MGEAKWRKQHQASFRSGNFSCVYCGNKANSADHMPPIKAFHNRRRPNELIFPSCIACNRHASDVDTIISWIARFYSSHGISDADISDLHGIIITRFPELASSLIERPLPKYQRLRSGVIVERNFHVVKLDDYFHRSVIQYGIKFALAMHWHSTGEVLSGAGIIRVGWFSNAQYATGNIPHDILRILEMAEPLRQGSFTSSNQFSYVSRGSKEKRSAASLCAFRDSIIIYTLTSENMIQGNGASVFCRDDFQRKYPFGLPRLSHAELRARFIEQRRQV